MKGFIEYKKSPLKSAEQVTAIAASMPEPRAMYEFVTGVDSGSTSDKFRY